VFLIARAVLPTLPELCGSTSTIEILELAGGLGAFFFGLLLRPIENTLSKKIAACLSDAAEKVYQN
jgi:hypothetical protein